MELTACAVDLTRGRVARGETTVELTARELALLAYLAANPSRTVSRDELLAEVWGYADSVVTRACDNTVRRLREKIEADPSRPDHLLTVHGEGYRFEPRSAEPVAPTEAPAGWWTELGAARVDLRRRLAEGPAGAHRLTEGEVRVLERLIRADGGVVERAELDRVAGTRRRGLDTLIGQLRAKLEADRADPKLILTHRGGGYRLERARAAPDALIGRAGALDAVRRARGGADWVLVLGPAGVGKSRLVRHAAPEAVWVGLGAARTADEATERIAAALGLSLRDVDELGAALALREGLVLVLDDLEGLAGAAALIDRWREQAPRVRWVGTSRVRVGARDEVVVELGPLDPDDAVTLFVRRAQAASSADPVPDLATAREIVDRLDRIPLAIELAAARTATLGLRDLADRLSTALLVRPPGGDPRHHSLAAVVRSSLDAVPEPALRALEQLALFRSGFFVEDAEALLGPDAVDLLQVLRDHSLLHRLPDLDGAARFDTWQAVREALPVEDPERVRRHCAHLAQVADVASANTLGREAELRRLVARVEDLRDAALRALPLDPDLAIRCATAAAQVHLWRGPYRTALDLLDRLVPALPVGARAELRLQRAYLRTQTSAGDAVGELQAAAEEAAAAERPVVEAHAWRELGYQRRRLGDLPGARAAYERALAVARRSGVETGLVELIEGQLAPSDEERLERFRDAATRARAAGARGLLRVALQGVADVAERQDGTAEARRALEALYAMEQAAGLTGGMLTAAELLAGVAMHQGDADALERWCVVVRDLAERVGSPVYRMRADLGLATVAMLRGRYAEADRLAADAADLPIPGPDARAERARIDLMRGDFAQREGDFERALRFAARAQAGFGEGTARYASARAVEGLAAAGAGDLPRARATLASRTLDDLEYWLVLDALLAVAEGADPRPHLDALAARLRRLEASQPTDAERVRVTVGAWAVERLGLG